MFWWNYLGKALKMKDYGQMQKSIGMDVWNFIMTNRWKSQEKCSLGWLTCELWDAYKMFSTLYLQGTPPPPIPPARRRCRNKGGRREPSESDSASLYRARSCERPPKARAAGAMMKRISTESDKLQSNLNKLSTNLSGKISASLIGKFTRNSKVSSDLKVGQQHFLSLLSSSSI